MIKNEIFYYPMHKAIDGYMGIGTACDTMEEAIKVLNERKHNLNHLDTQQWVKMVEITHIEVNP